MPLEESATPVTPAEATPPPTDTAPAPAPAPAADAPPADPAKVDPSADAPPEARDEPPPADDKNEPPPAPEAKDDKENWRGDVLKALPPEFQERGKSFLDKHASLSDVMRVALSSDAKAAELSETMKGMVKVPGKDAKPEELAAFDKARGVPDKAEEYKFPEAEANPFDAAAQPVLAQMAKDAGYTQTQLDAGIAMVSKLTEMANAEASARVAEYGGKAKESLMAEYGPTAYQANCNRVQRYVDKVVGQFMSEEERASFINFRDPATFGARGENTGFFRYLLSQAMLTEDAEILGDVKDGNEIDHTERKKEIMGMMYKEPDRYSSPEIQKELKDIIAAETRRAAQQKRA